MPSRAAGTDEPTSATTRVRLVKSRPRYPDSCPPVDPPASPLEPMTSEPTTHNAAVLTSPPAGITSPISHLTLSRDEARLLAVHAQGLDRRPPFRNGPSKAHLLETIRALGCVQLDTISVVSRSHETVLWSRLGRYDPALLAQLHHPDGALIEYWVHAAALVPVEFFPFLRRRMAFYAERDAWAQEHADVLERVRTRIRDGGPLASRDFERPDGPRPDPWTWWGGKPERRALDALWSAGELVVLKREGFQRTYDLTERVLPEAREAPLPMEAEQRRWFVERALWALGVATARWTADYFRGGSRPHVPIGEATAELTAMAAEGLAHRVTVEGLEEPAWLAPAQAAHLSEIRSGRRPTLTTLLSPFDNLVWHRGRTAALFGFDYRLESYTAAPKRRYGYYTLPILHRGRLVGRLDPSYDRRARVLTVKALHLEPGVRLDNRLAIALAGALQDFSAFLGGHQITLLACDPVAFGPLLRAALDTSVTQSARENSSNTARRS